MRQPVLTCANNSYGICLQDAVITIAAVFNKLRSLRHTTLEGPHRIPPRVLHELNKFLYTPLTILFNNLYNYEIIIIINNINPFHMFRKMQKYHPFAKKH